jgi:hypothetical protein
MVVLVEEAVAVWVLLQEVPAVLLGVVPVVEVVQELGQILLVVTGQQTLVVVAVAVHTTMQIIKVETVEKV